MEKEIDEDVPFSSSYDAYDGLPMDNSTVVGVSVDQQIANLQSLNRSLQAELDESIGLPSLSCRSFDAFLSHRSSYDGDDDTDIDYEHFHAVMLDLSTELGSFHWSPTSSVLHHGFDSADKSPHGHLSSWQSPLFSPLPITTMATHDNDQASFTHSVDRHSGIDSNSNVSSAFLSTSIILQNLASPPDFSPTASLSPPLPTSEEALPVASTTEQQHIRNLFDDDLSGMKTEENIEPPPSSPPNINPSVDKEAPLFVEGSTQSGPLTWAQINYEEIDMATLLKVGIIHPLVHPFVHTLTHPYILIHPITHSNTPSLGTYSNTTIYSHIHPVLHTIPYTHSYTIDYIHHALYTLPIPTYPYPFL